jgi:ATP-dependent helicase/nuclease subunit A
VKSSWQPPDLAERERALDPGTSFLVQAPAGAGKTELLVRRYLRLLAVVAEPEEILAVTFTRKAAAEMQGRIVNALAMDTNEDREAAPELRRLVEGVRARDAERHWQLSRHPARLRISTIDALNAALARSAPVSGGSSVLRAVAEQPERLYRLAARATLRLLCDHEAPGDSVARLLEHLDNDPGSAEQLLAQLLARRDQWLPFIGGGLDPVAARQALEVSLARLVDGELSRVESAMSASQRCELSEIVHAAAINLRVELGTGGTGSLEDRLAWWQFAVASLMTAAGDWRKRLTAKEGFPPGQGDLKTHALKLLSDLGNIPGMAGALATVRRLPAPRYSPEQWGALEALLRLLPFAAAELKLVFAAEGETDYAEIAAEGRAALGEDTEPSELALRVDWRLQHLLLDEFQDTSEAQYALLRALTRGWAPGDGRTLFLVGDPMQSIYRFRQAEVRLFLDVRDHGLPGITLEFLRLRTNFRSVPALVAWTNGVFPDVFPKADDLINSATSFAASEAAREGAVTDPAAVTLHATTWNRPGDEANDVLRVVRECLTLPGTIGILVRSRGHAAHIVAALRRAGIDLAASDLVELGRTALGNDLLAITRALVHPGDRLAWLTVLRAPWCGLSLADLTCLGAAPREQTLYDVAASAGDPATARALGLTPDGQSRVARLSSAFAAGLARLGQLPLRDVVEGVWTELGGPAVAGHEVVLADLILDEIGRHDVGADCPDVLALARALDKGRASLPGAEARVQVMTIHKAKGLEFDTVILPGLGRGVRGDQRPVLLWQELARDGGLDLLLAPVNARGADDDPLYELLWDLRLQQELAESDRLLYVAVTRARERLHLFGQTDPGTARAAPPAPRPGRGSLLDRIWHVLEANWPAVSADPGRPAPDAALAVDPAAGWRQPVLRRLPSNWRRPPPPTGAEIPRETVAATRPLVVYDWATAWARQAGSVAHRCLQQIAVDGVLEYTPERITALRPRYRQLLLARGVEAASVDRALERVVAVLAEALDDPNGRWLLSAEHSERLNEFAVTVADAGRFQQLIIDRAFVDADGVRWIIDYKTGGHEGGDREAFVRSEVERYSPQLDAYRQAFAWLEDRTVRTALYFPLLRLLQVVDPGA